MTNEILIITEEILPLMLSVEETESYMTVSIPRKRKTEKCAIIEAYSMSHNFEKSESKTDKDGNTYEVFTTDGFVHLLYEDEEKFFIQSVVFNRDEKKSYQLSRIRWKSEKNDFKNILDFIENAEYLYGSFTFVSSLKEHWENTLRQKAEEHGYEWIKGDDQNGKQN